MKRSSLESAAANYTYLRGLFFVPLGVLPVATALANWGWGPFVQPWVLGLVLVAIGVACIPINNYYNEHYGRLSPSTAQQWRGLATVVAALVIVVGGSALLRSEVSWSLDLPVNATAVTFAVVILLSYGIGVGLSRHHLIVWGSVLVAGALPIWDGPDPSNVGLVMVGLGIMMSGIFDHRLFLRTFGAPGVLTSEDTNAQA